jgi:hypothetical protein
MLLIVEVMCMDTSLPQSGAWTQYYHNQEHGHSTSTIRSIDTVVSITRQYSTHKIGEIFDSMVQCNIPISDLDFCDFQDNKTNNNGT